MGLCFFGRLRLRQKEGVINADPTSAWYRQSSMAMHANSGGKSAAASVLEPAAELGRGRRERAESPRRGRRREAAQQSRERRPSGGTGRRAVSVTKSGRADQRQRDL